MSVLQGQWVTDKSVWVKDTTGHPRRISLQLVKFSEPWKLLCGHLLESAHPPRGREEVSLTRNAMLLFYYSSAFHFQSGHAFVTKTLLKAQLWGALCIESSWSHPLSQRSPFSPEVTRGHFSEGRLNNFKGYNKSKCSLHLISNGADANTY